ncbi:MAG: transglutaminase domain-containing protein [Actinomycetota bacterium]|nr:transglutaminase domain-containing protein [Actinomycetota bacterium]
MNNPKITIKKIFLLLIIILLVSYLTSCRSGKDEEIVEAGIFSGIPDSHLTGSMNISGQAIDISISGNYAYLTNDLGVLYVIDIRDKKNPFIAGRCKDLESANIVIVKGDYAYISYTEWISNDYNDIYTNCGFYIVDIEDRQNPRLIGNYNTGENNNKSVYGMFIDEDCAYINTAVEDGTLETSNLEIVDISDKRDPEIVSKFEIDGLPSSIWVKDDLAYINVNFYDYDEIEYSNKSRLLIINIKNKDSPEFINSCVIPSGSWGLYVTKDHAYISSCRNEEDNNNYAESLLQIVSIEDPSNLKTAGWCEIPGGAWELDGTGDYIYVSSLSGGIYAVDVENSNDPVIADSLNTDGASYDITLEGNYGYIADGFGGMSIMELSGNSGGEEKLYYVDIQDKNLPPIAVIEVTGDKLEGGSYQIKNPVYFSAGEAFDPDGDELEYLWEVDGIKNSDEETFTYYFNKSGVYEVRLIVSDGAESDEATTEIAVEEIDLPIASSVKHDFKIKIDYTLFNNSVDNLKDINCFIRVPQTYYPYQIINDYSANYPDYAELLDNYRNALLHFEIDGELAGGKSLTVSVVIDTTVYEFRYRDIEVNYSDYDRDDPDFIWYTSDDLFIDSDNPKILNIAKSLTGSETDPVEIAKILYNYVKRNLYYDFSRVEEKDYELLYASEILERGKGICSDYAILYAALLRAADIPARLAAGIPVYTILFENEKEIDMGHAWIEIQMPDYGWIPVDITPEDDFMSANSYLDIATEKGSGYLYENKTMDWGSYYYDGFLFSWDSERVPKTEQKFLFKVSNIDLRDIMLD